MLKCPKCHKIHTTTNKVFKCDCGVTILPLHNAKVFEGEILDWEKELLTKTEENGNV